MNARRRLLGLTMIELMIVVAVIAIVLVLAAPSFTNMVEVQRLKSISAQLRTDLQFARGEAAGRQELVGLTFKPNASGLSCYTVHSCGTNATCTCDCSAAEGSRCTAPQSREIRTVLIPTSSNVKIKPVSSLSGVTTAPNRVMFDPTTGGMTLFFVISVLMPTPPPATELWVESQLIRAGTPPAVRTEVSAAGRPRECSPGGLVSGVPAC